jgi:PPM family protein phosphatase
LHSGYRLRVAQHTDAGRSREQNEDSFGRLETAANSAGVDLFVVADGMGGHVAGEVASRVAVETILTAFGQSSSEDDLAARLRVAVARANAEVYIMGITDLRLAGMGTTVVAAAVSDAGLTLANVGDSRAYLLREGALTQLTRDHSWVERAVEDGVLTPAQARDHPDRHVIYRSLGAEPEVQVDTFEYALAPADRVLLCSDGLTDVVGDELLAELAAGDDPDDAARRLIEAANDAGGPDNITITLIVVDAHEISESDRPATGDAERATESFPHSVAEIKSARPSDGLANWLRRLFRSRS